MSRPCECHACTASHNSKLLSPPSSTALPNTMATEKLDLTAHSPASYLFYPNISNHQPLDLSHHGITAKHPLIHPHLYNLTSQKPTKLSNHTTTAPVQPTFQPNLEGSGGPAGSDTVLRDHLAAHTYLYGDWNSAYENAKMILHSRGYGHDTDPDLLQSVRAALQSNCSKGGDNKGVTQSPPTSTAMQQGDAKDVHCKQHSSRPQKEAKKKSSSAHVCTDACANTALLPPDGWGPSSKEQLLAQFQQQHAMLSPPLPLADSPKKNGVVGRVETSKADAVMASSGPEMCAKHNLPVVLKTMGTSQLSSPKASSVVSQQQQLSSSSCSQVAGGHFGNLPPSIVSGGGGQLSSQQQQQQHQHSRLSSSLSMDSHQGHHNTGSSVDGTSKPPSSNKKKRPAPDTEDLLPLTTDGHMGLPTGKGITKIV